MEKKMKLTKEIVLALYQEYLVSLGYKKVSVKRRMLDARKFLDYLETIEKIKDIRNAGREMIVRFARFLDTLTTLKTNKPYAVQTKQMIIIAVNQLFRCLYQKEFLLTNPMQELSIQWKKKEKRKETLSEEDMAALLDGIDL